MTAGPEITTAPVVVVGGGIAGLAATRELLRNGLDVVLYESGSSVGGMADSHHDTEGFTFDTGAHFITNRLAAATGIHQQCRDVEHYGETVWLGGRSYDYPTGLLRVPRFLRAAIAERAKRHSMPPVTATDRFRRDYGNALADEIALPLVEAWSGAPANELAPAVADKIPGGIAGTVGLKLSARLTHRAVAVGYCREAPQSANVWHVYPEHGISTVCERLAADVADSVRLRSPVERITVSEGRAVGVRVAGQQVPAAAVISTAPINVLPRLVEGTDVLEPFQEFQFRSMVFVNLRMRGRDLLPHTMTWTPEPQLPFFRLTETPQAMPWLAPEGKTLITADIGVAIGDPFWEMDDADLGQLCIDALTEIVPTARRDYLGCRVVRQPNAYPVFRLDYEPARRQLATTTGVDRLLSIGRNGEFAHILMEDVYWRTVRRARRLAAELKAATSDPGSFRGVPASL
ncbi:MAG: protoporphyrinogen/coproporphyrinogen oxidase [Acidimicrobiia bacterium]